jgi:hypothetical protein
MICNKCNIDKEIENFTIDGRRKSGYYPWCKPCKAKWTREYRQTRNWYVEVLTKLCPKCNIEKDRSDFHRNRIQSDGLKPWCKKCDLDHKKKDYMSNNKRNSYLLRKYNISLQEYENLLDKQNGVCAICKKKCQRGYLSVDHNHKTNEVRALLCRYYNVAIGNMKEDPSLLRAAAKYIEDNLRQG